MAVLVSCGSVEAMKYPTIIYVNDRLSSTRATLIAIFCTLSEAFDVPVYWPILVMYFFVLFTLTMRRQIQSVSPILPLLIHES